MCMGDIDRELKTALEEGVCPEHGKSTVGSNITVMVVPTPPYEKYRRKDGTDRVVGLALQGGTDRVVGLSLQGGIYRVVGLSLQGETDRLVGLTLRGGTGGPTHATRRQTGVPYRNAAGLTDENKLLEAIIRKDVMTSLNDEEIKAHRDAGKTPRDAGKTPRDAGKTPRDAGKHPPGPSISPAQAPSDNDLMTVMMSRLTQSEKQVHLQTRQLIDKDKKIETLERKLSLLRKTKDSDNPGHAQQLEQKCLHLQEQILDMESFLADYGMMWVGDKFLSSTDNTSEDDFPTDRGHAGKEMWSQGSSQVKKGSHFHVDYNLVIKNIEELNILAGEGVAKIQQTQDGARLKMPDPIPLTLYANGIVMFAGPFRSFEESVTQRCLGDIMDGYFPSELQERFPDGIPFQVTDKRSVEFVDRLSQIFEGRGELLGGETKPSRLVPTNLKDSVTGREGAGRQETSKDLPGPKLSMEQFLNKVPQSVIKQGRVVDIRQSLHDSLQSSDSSTPDVIVVDTPSVVEMRERLKVDPKDRPVSSRQLTTLRIKNETGNHTYILKMRFSDTIRDVRLCLNAERSGKSTEYEIISTFPRHTYSDDTVTLEDCGLTPSAALLLKPKRK